MDYISIAVFILCCVLFLSLIWISDGDLTLMWAEKFGTPISTVKGKVFWIVGASSGIGEQLSYKLAAHGAKLVISARRESELHKIKARCLSGEKYGLVEQDILVLPVDVNKFELHQEYFDLVLQHFGKLDVLVNNAGRSQKAEFQNIDIRVDKELFDVNVFGLINLSRVVVPHFLNQKRGHIVVTSSVCGKMGAAFSATYNATKHALHGYFETVRSELAPKGIAVTMLCPGPVFSDILSACATENPGEKLGGEMDQNDPNRMLTERCAQLCSVAIVNRLDEAWIALNPVLLFLYFSQYAPSLCRTFLSRFGVRAATKSRGKRDASRT